MIDEIRVGLESDNAEPFFEIIIRILASMHSNVKDEVFMPRGRGWSVCSVHGGVPLPRIAAGVIDAIRVEARGPSHGPVYHVALAEQELGQVGPILSGEYRDERFLEQFFLRFFQTKAGP
jgi:hypothetical protein